MTDKKNVNEYRIKPSFLKLSLFFALGLGSFSAWSFNSMCHSPTQLAALMSPNKPNLSKGEKIRKRIRALEKKTEEYDDKLDDAEGDLGDSLRKDKLKDDPYSVAGSVRSYIENHQKGWPCAEAGSGGRRTSTIGESLLLKINVWELIIPSAYANNEIQQNGGNTDETNIPSVSDQINNDDSNESTDIEGEGTPAPARKKNGKTDTEGEGTPAPARKKNGKTDTEGEGTPAPARKKNGKTDTVGEGTPAPARMF